MGYCKRVQVRELFSSDAREPGHEVNQTAQTSNKHRNFTYMIVTSPHTG